MLRTALAATATLPLLAGCATVQQPTAVAPVAEKKARVVFYTASDYRPIVAHGVRLNETDIGRLNGPNLVSIHDVEPGKYTADMIRAGLFADKSPKSSQERDLQAGEIWYLRVNEYGVNCRVVSEAETIIMSGLLGLAASKLIDGPVARRCDYFNPDLTAVVNEDGRAAVNQIVYGVADPAAKLATSAASPDSEPPTLDQIKADWPLLEKAVARHVERNRTVVESGLSALPGSMRVYKYEPIESRPGTAASDFGVVVRLNVQFDSSPFRFLTSKTYDMLINMHRGEDGIVGIVSDTQPVAAARQIEIEPRVTAPVEPKATDKRISPAAAKLSDNSIPPAQAKTSDNWRSTESLLRRHVEQHLAYVEGEFQAVPGSTRIYRYQLIDTLPGSGPGDYLLLVRLHAEYNPGTHRISSSSTRDMLFHMREATEGVAVQSVSPARPKQ